MPTSLIIVLREAMARERPHFMVPHGRYYRLPIYGQRVQKLEAPFVQIHFADNDQSILQIDGEFLFGSGSDIHRYAPSQPGILKVLCGLENSTVTEALADRGGELTVTFEHGDRLVVPDGPYENWHYRNKKGQTAHGGVGGVF